MKLHSPYDVKLDWNGLTYEEPKEEVQPEHEWFAPFHKAAASGLVDGSVSTREPHNGPVRSDQRHTV